MSTTLANSQSDFDCVAQFFDKKIVKTDFLTIVKLLIYFPVGLVLVLIRSSLLVLFKFILNIFPGLKSNTYFIKIVCLLLGIHTRCRGLEKNDITDSQIIYVSNHVTCLDYFSIKSTINNLNYFKENSSILPDGFQSSGSSFNIFSSFVLNLLQPERLLDNFNIRTKQNYPALFFPEKVSTNGTFGLLKFDLQAFNNESQTDDNSARSKLTFKPICLKVQRTFIPFSVNYLYSNDLINILISMFLPITIYELNFLPSESKKDNEAIEELTERTRNKIANELKIQCSKLGLEDLKNIWTNYNRILMNRNNNRNRNQQTNSNQNRPNNLMSFADISRLALQIKDILPDVSFDIIQQHIRSAPLLDIDTIIASILDSNYQENQASSIPSTSNPSSSSRAGLQETKSSKNLSYLSYEEKKFNLLNEARKRYLAKQENNKSN